VTRTAQYVYKPGDKHAYAPRNCNHCGAAYLARKDSNVKGRGSLYCSKTCSGLATNPATTGTDRPGWLRCVKCKQEKPEHDFCFSSRRATGRRERCRTCQASDYQADLAAMTPAHRTRARERARKWSQANPDKVRAKERRYRERHPQRRLAIERRRRTLTREVFGVEITDATLAAKWGYWGSRCWMCRGVATEWDHIKPVNKGGRHILANLRPACRSCNPSKSDKWPVATAPRFRFKKGDLP
jgi:5-methylcytosine-specific restriction endonuclease McrA